MGTKIINGIVKNKRRTLAEWVSTNPILEAGVVGYDKTNKKQKMGDGLTHWIDLPYTGSGDSDTVNGKTVLENVPVGAKFTDTIYTHPTGPGNKHIPSGGSVNQVLKNTADGVAVWAEDNDTITTVNGKTGAIVKADIVALGISAQDTITTINGKTGAIVKADIVALGIPAQDTVYVHPGTHSADILVDGTTNKVFSSAEKNKLLGISAGAEVNVQPDWNATSGDALILNKPTTIAGYGITDTYTKSEIDNKVSALYRYAGSVATYANLPTANMAIGDVYNVLDTGINYAWEGTLWDDLGGVETLASLESDGLLSKADFLKLSGIEPGAEVNNISDVNATGLTSGTDTSLHYHSADRNRANHTGTQLASTISDFAANVRTTPLTGIVLTNGTAITATDTTLTAFGKIQKQITDNLTTLTTHIADAVKHITATERTNWGSAYTHIVDAVKHITSTERTNWGTAYTNSHTHGNKASLDLTSGTNTGNETSATVGALINSSTAKATPVDADMIGLMDSANANTMKKLSWAQVRATLFLNTPLTGTPTATTAAKGTNTKQVATTEFVQDALSGGVTIDFATQAEAETGTDNTKAMTPLRVFQSVAKWFEVTALGTLDALTNATISATDNVKGALMKLQGQVTALANAMIMEGTETVDTSIPALIDADRLGGNFANYYAAKSSIIDASIGTTWIGSAAPYTQNISIPGVTVSSIVEVSLPYNATIPQMEAYQLLILRDGGQSAGVITIKTYSIPNTISIPIQVIVRGDH